MSHAPGVVIGHARVGAVGHERVKAVVHGGAHDGWTGGWRPFCSTPGDDRGMAFMTKALSRRSRW